MFRKANPAQNQIRFREMMKLGRYRAASTYPDHAIGSLPDTDGFVGGAGYPEAVGRHIHTRHLETNT